MKSKDLYQCPDLLQQHLLHLRICNLGKQPFRLIHKTICNFRSFLPHYQVVRICLKNLCQLGYHTTLDIYPVILIIRYGRLRDKSDLRQFLLSIPSLILCALIRCPNVSSLIDMFIFSFFPGEPEKRDVLLCPLQ